MIGIQEEHAQIVKYLSKFTNKANVTLIRNIFSKLSSYTESFIHNIHFVELQGWVVFVRRKIPSELCMNVNKARFSTK